jgi:hypothetical protein
VLAGTVGARRAAVMGPSGVEAELAIAGGSEIERRDGTRGAPGDVRGGVSSGGGAVSEVIFGALGDWTAARCLSDVKMLTEGYAGLRRRGGGFLLSFKAERGRLVVVVERAVRWVGGLGCEMVG